MEDEPNLRDRIPGDEADFYAFMGRASKRWMDLPIFELEAIRDRYEEAKANLQKQRLDPTEKEFGFLRRMFDSSKESGPVIYVDENWEEIGGIEGLVPVDRALQLAVLCDRIIGARKRGRKFDTDRCMKPKFQRRARKAGEVMDELEPGQRQVSTVYEEVAKDEDPAPGSIGRNFRRAIHEGNAKSRDEKWSRLRDLIDFTRALTPKGPN